MTRPRFPRIRASPNTVCDGLPPPDFGDARRKLSAWDAVPDDAVERSYLRGQELATWLVQVEREAPPTTSTPHLPLVGAAVRLPGTGVAVVLGIDGDKLWLSMLSRASKPVAKFMASAARPVHPPAVGELLLVPVPRELFVT